MTHLDASFIVRSLDPALPESRRLREWIKEGAAVGVSSVAWAEFMCGPVEQIEVDQVLAVVKEPVPLVRADAEAAAQLFNATGRRKGSLADCMIAAIALRVGASVATADTKDFTRFTKAGLRVVTA